MFAKTIVMLLLLNVSHAGQAKKQSPEKTFKKAVDQLRSLKDEPGATADLEKKLKLTEKILTYRDDFNWSLLMHAVAAGVSTEVFDGLVELMPRAISERDKQGLNIPMLAFNKPDLFRRIWQTFPAWHDRWLSERNRQGNTALMMIFQDIIDAPDSGRGPATFFNRPEELDQILEGHGPEPNNRGFNVYNLAYKAGLGANLARIHANLDPWEPRSKLILVNFVDGSSDQMMDIIENRGSAITEWPLTARTSSGRIFLEELMYRHPRILATLPNDQLMVILRNHFDRVFVWSMSDSLRAGAFATLVDEMHLRLSPKMLADVLLEIDDPDTYGRALRFAKHHHLNISSPELVAAVAADPSETKRTLLLGEVPIEFLVDVWKALDSDRDINPVFLKFKELLLKSACLIGSAEVAEVRKIVSDKKSPEVLQGFVRDVVSKLNHAVAKRELHFNELARRILVQRSKDQLGEKTELECQNCYNHVAVDEMVFDGSGELPKYCRECLVKSAEMGAPLTDGDEKFDLLKGLNLAFMRSQGISGTRLERIKTSRLKLELKRAFSNWRSCPNESCFYGKEVTSADDTHLECPICDTIICLACGKKHGGACDEYEKNVEAVRAMVGKNIRPCPYCLTPIEKGAGCNAMTCGNCNQRFHWNRGASDNVVHDSRTGEMAWDVGDSFGD